MAKQIMWSIGISLAGGYVFMFVNGMTAILGTSYFLGASQVASRATRCLVTSAMFGAPIGLLCLPIVLAYRSGARRKSKILVLVVPALSSLIGTPLAAFIGGVLGIPRHLPEVFLIKVIIFVAVFCGTVMLLCRGSHATPALNACAECGYDLYGNTSGACPECGTDCACE
jgi:hypothetical protein